MNKKQSIENHTTEKKLQNNKLNIKNINDKQNDTFKDNIKSDSNNISNIFNKDNEISSKK